jgi:hypothetical protein
MLPATTPAPPVRVRRSVQVLDVIDLPDPDPVPVPGDGDGDGQLGKSIAAGVPRRQIGHGVVKPCRASWPARATGPVTPSNPWSPSRAYGPGRMAAERPWRPDHPQDWPSDWRSGTAADSVSVPRRGLEERAVTSTAAAVAKFARAAAAALVALAEDLEEAEIPSGPRPDADEDTRVGHEQLPRQILE